CQQHNTYPYGF
nr:immunoglobulin light chain junction region [Macaca mulatta]MOW62156.1 immunoglobulin light chain junction region [Macaca mulatta]MOW62355.1 immunoglobulin light chain junction region [Macaca mulatta]MOW62534.1 immunoglobulin light chain junction region [Macaca mulatta]MOW62933.1 immunoglobulin light chain junction region [Macaca mulatta]